MSTKITWLGHATFELRFDSGEVLILDPWVDGNPKFPKDHKFDKADVIAVTHAHSDHFTNVVSLAKQFGSRVIAIYETATWLKKQGIDKAEGINKGGTVDLGFAKLTMTHALHSNAIADGDQIVYAGEAAGYVLTLKNGKRAYFSGDTALYGDMALIGDMYKPELAFLCIGDHFTMGPDQAAQAAKFLKVQRVIPMHYGTFPALTGTTEALAKNLEGTGVQVWTLQPGQTVEW